MRLMAWITAGLVAVGCGTARLDAGSSGGADAGSNGGSLEGHVWSGTPSNSLNLPCGDLDAPEWLSGTWEGQFDSHALPSGSTNVRIDVRGAYQSKGGLCGTVTFGVGDPLPLPTDPAAPPPGGPSVAEAASESRIFVQEGFPYEFYVPGPQQFVGQDASFPVPPAIERKRIRFPIHITQPYKAWCEMQTAYSVDPRATNLLNGGGSGYSCLPPHGARVTSDDPACGGVPNIGPATCAQVAFCIQGDCGCYGTGIMVDLSGLPVAHDGCTLGYRSDSPHFDLTVADVTMAGNVVFSDRVEGMHLTRAP